MAKPLSYNVHDAEFTSLKAKFYQGSPDVYFGRRLKSQAIAIGDGSEFDDLLQAGVSYGDLSMKSGDNDADQDPSDQKDVDDHAAVESAVLLHHTAEPTLRLHLAHAIAIRDWLESRNSRVFASSHNKELRLPAIRRRLTVSGFQRSRRPEYPKSLRSSAQS